jgi:hypothetical protein
VRENLPCEAVCRQFVLTVTVWTALLFRLVPAVLVHACLIDHVSSVKHGNCVDDLHDSLRACIVSVHVGY